MWFHCFHLVFLLIIVGNRIPFAKVQALPLTLRDQSGSADCPLEFQVRQRDENGNP